MQSPHVCAQPAVDYSLCQEAQGPCEYQRSAVPCCVTEQRQADLKLLEAPDIGTGIGGKPKVLIPKAVDADEENDEDDESSESSSDDEVCVAHRRLLHCCAKSYWIMHRLFGQTSSEQNTILQLAAVLQAATSSEM